MKKIFSELEGFAIYDPRCLDNYISDNQLFNKNLLSYFTETSAGDFISQNGIIIPIMGVESDYYAFELVENIPEVEAINESKGWILNVISNQINVVGMGYLTDIKTINEENTVSFTVSNGWYRVSIITYQDFSFHKIFGLKLEKSLGKPNFQGDMG